MHSSNETTKTRTVGDLYLPASKADKKRFDEAVQRREPVAFDIRERSYLASDPAPYEEIPWRKSTKPTRRHTELFTSTPTFSLSLSGILPALLISVFIGTFGAVLTIIVAGADATIAANLAAVAIVLLAVVLASKPRIHRRLSTKTRLRGTFAAPN